jgi:hypothetical protein
VYRFHVKKIFERWTPNLELFLPSQFFSTGEVQSTEFFEDITSNTQKKEVDVILASCK